jgi:hypothetical protein
MATKAQFISFYKRKKKHIANACKILLTNKYNSIWQTVFNLRNEKKNPEEKNITVYAHQRNAKVYKM